MKPIIQLIICENSNSQTGRTIIENPFSMISLPFMPTNLSFRVVIVVANIDYTKTYKFSLNMYESENHENSVFTQSDAFIGPFSKPSESVTRLENLNLEIAIPNISIRKPGIYTIEVGLDGVIKEQELLIEHHPDKAQ